MVNPDKIEEWIREVEERPTSAPAIIRYIGNRLSDLSARNEDLLAENIELRMGRKVEDYENRIANLEYQIDLLKRQFRGDPSLLLEADTPSALSLIFFTPYGQVLRTELSTAELKAGQVGTFSQLEAGGGTAPRLLAAAAEEELLLVFDSGRTLTMPVSALPAAPISELDWSKASLQEPRGGEELAIILPVARMSLFDLCIQVSRRGCVKRIMEQSFETHIASGFIGTGVETPSDKTCSLTLCGKDDLVALVSQEGFMVGLDAGRLPFTIEETIKLSPSDHVIQAFAMAGKPSVVWVTQNGKAIYREAGWIEVSPSFRTHGQSVIPKARRDAGVRLVGAAAVEESDWSVTLHSDGVVQVDRMADLFASGSVLKPGSQAEVLAFTVFANPEPASTSRKGV